MRIVIVADTHGYHLEDARLPPGDMIVHCGDATNVGKIHEVAAFTYWYGHLPYRHRILIAGNHDWLFQTDGALARQMCRDNDIIYLEDQGRTIEGLHIYGTPHQPRFCDWAFNLDELDLADRFGHIPGGLDLLITHCPPHGILDESNYDMKTRHIGARALREVVDKVRPRVHCFGHNHGQYGQLRKEHTHFINAAICTPRYVPSNEPVVIDLDPK